MDEAPAVSEPGLEARTGWGRAGRVALALRALLALVGVAPALRAGPGPARLLLAWAALHLLLAEALVGHLTARLLLSATPALAGLSALGAQDVLRRRGRPGLAWLPHPGQGPE